MPRYRIEEREVKIHYVNALSEGDALDKQRWDNEEDEWLDGLEYHEWTVQDITDGGSRVDG
jgi:hypothetical protein